MGIEKPDNLPFAYSKRLYQFIAKAKEKILFKDRMVIGIIWGDVGSGKSVRAHEFMYIISGDKATIDKIAFDKNEFVKAVLISEKEAIIGDEGISIFFSRGAMTKEGRLMAELMGQCRQKNLVILICIPDILAVDSMVLAMANFVCHVWESEKEISPGVYKTIKGNMAIWPKFRKNDYKKRIIRYLRVERSNSNPFVKNKKPRPWHLEPGSPVGSEAFYCVPKDQYIAKKEAILNKYRNALERKPRNNNVDYPTMDKLIKSGMPLNKVAQLLNVSYPLVKKRKAERYRKDKKTKKPRRKTPAK